jgi:ABC-type Fe3+ transport system permease subunit
MNRSFFIVLIPALAVGIGYFYVLRYLHIPPSYWRLGGAASAFVAAVVLVHHYRRRHPKRGEHPKRAGS